MKESGYKTSADFIDYLLRGNKGRQIDRTTLKQFVVNIYILLFRKNSSVYSLEFLL